MEYRPLTGTDFRVSVLGLGCSRIGSVLSPIDKEGAVRLIEEAIDQGINFFDTADIYGQGLSETILGQVRRRRRDEMIIATKVGYLISTSGAVAGRVKPLIRRAITIAPFLKRAIGSRRAAQIQQDFSAGYITAAVERSLNRLRVEAIDLLQLHDPPPESLSSGEAIDTLESLKQQGKIRFFGMSFRTLQDALIGNGGVSNGGGISTFQLPVNASTLSAGPAALERARDLGIGVIAREVMDGGRLPPERSLQYALQQAGVATVLTGTTSIDHLRDNARALAVST